MLEDSESPVAMLVTKLNGLFPDNVAQGPQDWLDEAAMSWSTSNFKGQKYSSIKKDLVKNGELFVDPEFPPSHKSLFFSKVDKEIEWKRPKELCKVPKLVVEGVTCDDLNEGELGNSWFVSACASLAQDSRLWQKVVPDSQKQEWGGENVYAGIFHFHFWRYGQWVDVVIDDQLPTKDGKLIFCHSKSKNEFWSALLEKAYAKLYGDYESLATGYTIDALVDFTGGIAERLDLVALGVDNPFVGEEVLKTMVNASDNKALMVASIRCEPEEVGQEFANGLVKGHGYGVTRVLDAELPRTLKQALGKDSLKLVRLSNPWGGLAWTGAWSDDSEEMKQLTMRDRENLGIVFDREGECWMSFEDFCQTFTDASICHFVNTSFFTLKKSWSEAMHHGEWTLGPSGSAKDRAGGSETHRTFLANPQYVFDIPGEDIIMISLEQDDTHIGRSGSDESAMEIGFHVMKVEENRRYRVHIPGHKMAVSEYVRLRSIFRRVELTKGRYVIIPSTKEPEQVGRFLLRMYTGSKSGCKELTEECPTPGPACCGDPHALVTRLIILGADELQTAKGDAAPNPLVHVVCEGETVKSTWLRDTAAPNWNLEVIFYRKKPQECIEVEVYHHKAVKNELLGVAYIEEQGDETPKRVELELFGKKKEREIQKPGKLYVEITSSDDLRAL